MYAYCVLWFILRPEDAKCMINFCSLVVFVGGDVIHRVANLVREILTGTSCHLV